MEGLHASDTEYSANNTCRVKNGEYIFCGAAEPCSPVIYVESAASRTGSELARYAAVTQDAAYGVAGMSWTAGEGVLGENILGETGCHEWVWWHT